MLKLPAGLKNSLSSGNVWIVIMMAFGAILTIVYKFQNTMYVYQGPYYKYNFHPFIQAFNMFIGQFMSLPIFYWLKYRNKQQYLQKEKNAVIQGKQLNMNKLYLFIPAFLDLLTSTMQFIALNFVSASAYQMLKGGSIITTYIFSITLLKNKIQRKQTAGSALALLGLIIVGLGNTLFTGSGGNSQNFFLALMGYVLLVASLVTNGLFFAFQQKLLDKYHLEPLQVVGWQGLFGLIMYFIIIPILCYVPCYFGPNACVYSSDGYPYMQGVSSYFNQLSQNYWLIILNLAAIFGIFVFNIAGVTVTKKVNALARAIANMTKSIFVWVLSLTVTLLFGPTYPNLQWQSLLLQVIIFQIIGFIFMVIGNLVYSNIIKVKVLQNKSQRMSANINYQQSKVTYTQNLLSKKSQS